MEQPDSNEITPLVDQRSKAWLSGLNISEQQTSALVNSVIEQRQQMARMNTTVLERELPRLQAQEAPAPSPARSQPARARKRRLLLTALWQRRVPVLLQLNAVECGAACLAMILQYYGRRVSISEIRERSDPGRDGLTALSIVKQAQNYGLRVRALSLKENDLRFVRLPAIVHWEFNHFLVVERWTPAYVDVVDPAIGRRHLTQEEFDAGFTGIVLALEPGAHFLRNQAAPQVSLSSYARGYLALAPGALTQILLASLLLQLFGLSIPLLTEIVVNRIIPLQLTGVLAVVGLGILTLVLAQLITTLLRSSLVIYLQARVDTQMMMSFLEHLLALPLRFFQQNISGDILTRLSSNTVIRDILSNQMVSNVLDGSTVIVYLAILLWQGPIFALLVVLLGLAQVVVLLSTRQPIQHLARRELTAQGATQGYVAEALTGIVTLKAAGAERRTLDHWSNLFFEQLNVSMRRQYLSSLVNAVMSALRLLAPLLLLWVGTMQVINGQMQLGTMLALNALALGFLTPVSSLVNTGQTLQLVQSHLERIADVMDAAPEQEGQAHQPPGLTGHIVLQNVSFRYNEQSPEILRGINLSVDAGKKVAIVGRTGSGKSTLGKLLLGLYLPNQGEILYDGIPLRFLDYQAVRAQFGVVMQDATIFSGSIRQNIALSDPEMSLERIARAAQAAALHEDIMRMPMGYETFVSEHGSALSGGQRQRLALARALAHAPSILLLDEATSALDVMTEQVVEQNLRALPCTQIIIAHRLSTIRNADLILVLDQGRIVEQGTHQQLIQGRGYYASLIQSQLASGEVKAM
jgi:ATP-binding cassette, subfamily B, bacterial